MSWFVVGGVAVGATAGAIVGSKKGGDDVWKDALIGGALGGTLGAGAGAISGAGVFGGIGAAEAAAPAAVAGEGILGGSGLALGGAGLETGGAMAGAAPIVANTLPAAEAAAVPAVAGEAAGGFGSAFTGVPAALPGSEAGFGSFGGATVGETGGASALGSAGGSSSLADGFKNAMSWVGDNKMATGLGLLAMSGVLNRNNSQTFNNPQVTPAGYQLGPNFQPSRVDPQKFWYNQANLPQGQQVQGYAHGGIIGMARGGEIDWGQRAQQYAAMADPTANAAGEAAQRTRNDLRMGDVGIYHDSDPDTVHQDALTAAQTRMAKLAGKSNVKLGAMQKASPLGKIELVPVTMQQEQQGRGYAAGGIMQSAPVNVDFMGGDMYPQSQIQRSYYNVPTQMPTSAQQAMASYEPNTNPLTGEATAHMASGGITSLGGYAAGGNPHLLKGPGDGMSDDIPASIAGKQPARLADGEFVVPADVVSGLGNGSTDAGAKKLHKLMDDVRVARTGTKKQGKKINADKHLSATATGGKVKATKRK